jgi:hypothetical protein
MSARARTLALGLMLLSPAALGAQGLPPLPDPNEPPRRGGILLSLSPVAYGTFTGDGLTDANSENGSGFAFALGFGLTERIWMLADLTRTDLVIEAGSAYGLWQIDPILRLATFKKQLGPVGISPFVDVGGGLTKAIGERPAVGGTEKIIYSGSVVTGGVGINVFVQRRWAVTAGVHGSIGMITDFKRGNVTQSNIRINERTTRMNIGASYFLPIGSGEIPPGR